MSEENNNKNRKYDPPGHYSPAAADSALNQFSLQIAAAQPNGKWCTDLKIERHCGRKRDWYLITFVWNHNETNIKFDMKTETTSENKLCTTQPAQNVRIGRSCSILKAAEVELLSPKLHHAT